MCYKKEFQYETCKYGILNCWYHLLYAAIYTNITEWCWILVIIYTDHLYRTWKHALIINTNNFNLFCVILHFSSNPTEALVHALGGSDLLLCCFTHKGEQFGICFTIENMEKTYMDTGSSTLSVTSEMEALHAEPLCHPNSLSSTVKIALFYINTDVKISLFHSVCLLSTVVVYNISSISVFSDILSLISSSFCLC